MDITRFERISFYFFFNRPYNRDILGSSVKCVDAFRTALTEDPK